MPVGFEDRSTGASSARGAKTATGADLSVADGSLVVDGGLGGQPSCVPDGA